VLKSRGAGVDPARPVYVISVAANIVSAHPRTLRIYEEEGLICPSRTESNIRLFSENVTSPKTLGSTSPGSSSSSNSRSGSGNEFWNDCTKRVRNGNRSVRRRLRQEGDEHE
jgi:hypothetical protein